MASGERRFARSRKEHCFGKSEARLDAMAPIAPYTAPTAAPDGPDWEVRGPSPARFMARRSLTGPSIPMA
jgi:hypothetical protein